VNNQIKALKDPIEFFQLFFGDGIFEELCDLTDIHYNQKHKSKHKKRDSHHRRWQKSDLSSMKCYFGILLYMGIVQKPTIGHYWRTSQLFGSKGISQLMNEEHWQDINSNLYFIDEEVKSDESDPLYKIQPLIKHIISVSQEYYSPEKNLTIDESMIRFRGRSKFKVYMSLKPIRFGFKAYVLAESSSGYMLNWKLHEGKKSTLKEIVEYLTSPYKERNHIIYMDRFYTTISVIERLHETGFGFYGAIMKRRAQVEPKVKSQVDSLEKHKSLFFVSSDRNKILIIWMDSKKVHIISSIGDDSHSEIKRKRDKKGPESILASCPNNIRTYSQHSRGVDLLDQMIGYYNLDLCSRKWYKPIVIHLLQIAVYNSYLLFRKTTQKHFSFIKYQESIIRELIAPMRKKNQSNLHQ